MKPACLSGHCPIVDIAPDVKLNRQVRAFLEAEALELSPAYAQFQRRILKDAEIDKETPQTILEMKAVIAEYRNKSASNTEKNSEPFKPKRSTPRR